MKLKHLTSVLTVALIALSPISTTVAFAGWISGGGELVKNKNNPWYVQNTTTVRYCLLADAATFHMSLDRLDELVGQAIDYWRDEFRLANFWAHPPFFQPMTQTFVREACGEDTDLRIQFGVLSDLQRAGLSGVDPREHVAFTIRTNYDERLLRAKGFLYVTPDNGPERYRGSEYRDGVWHEENNYYLRQLLSHELGHVFGLTHFGHGIMGEEFGEHLVQYRITVPAAGSPAVSTLAFNFEVPRQICKWDDDRARMDARNFFALPADFECLKFEFARDSGTVKTATFAYLRRGTWHAAGRIDFNSLSTGRGNFIRIKFRAEQGVFPVDGPGSILGGANAPSELRGWFAPAGSAALRYVNVDFFDPEAFILYGMEPTVGLRSVLFYSRSSEPDN